MPTVKNDIKLKEARTKIKSLTAKYNHVLKENESLKKLLEVKKGISGTEPAKIDIPKSKTGELIVPWLIASDWHIEEQVEADTVNFMNEYTPDIAERRAKEFFAKGLQYVELFEKAYDCHKIGLGLLGDFISGYIHQELEENNHLSPTQAILKLKEFIYSGIDFLLEHTDKNLEIVCCFGNHGRTTQKIKVSTGYKNNFEWMFYQGLKQDYQKNKRVRVHVNNGYMFILDCIGTKIRFHHGDGMKYGGGVGGITIPVNKKIAKWNEGPNKADLDVFGHFHTFFDGGKFICNGSLIGMSPYAIRIGASFEPPRQAFFVIHEFYGKIASLQIPVEEPIDIYLAKLSEKSKS